MTAPAENDLTILPEISFSFVENFICGGTQSSGKEQLTKGFKYYSEKYVKDVRLYPDDGGCRIKARCFKSQKKTQPPHTVEVYITKDGHGTAAKVDLARCSCEIGAKGCCGHISAILYQLAFYKMMGIKSIPTDVAKTSLPQTWHIPRGETLRGNKLDDIIVQGYDRDDPYRRTKGVHSTLYQPNPNYDTAGPINELVDKLRDTNIIFPTVVEVNNEKVQTRFGQYPKGSVLSYQQKLSSEYILNIMDGNAFPDLPVRNCMENNVNYVLDQRKTSLLQSLEISESECREIAMCTKTQSLDPKWHKLRQDRITASKAGEIAKRRKDGEKLAERLKTGRSHTSEAMKYGIAAEGTAALAYSKKMNDAVNLYPCGVVISPYSHWLAASPDRLVYDPSRNMPHGLLEIKSTLKPLHELVYLKDVDGVRQLKDNDNYYYQCQMQMAVTGLPWCDFFVWSEEESHLETIRFDMDFWCSAKDKLDLFFLTHYLS